MRKRRVKRNSKFLFLRIFIPFIISFAVLVGLYFLFPQIVSEKLISPLSEKLAGNDKDTVASSLTKAGIYYSSIETSTDSSYVITLLYGGQAVLAPKKNIREQISSLQLMLKRLTIEGKRVKTIDFRYDRPVIRF